MKMMTTLLLSTATLTPTPLSNDTERDPSWIGRSFFQIANFLKLLMNHSTREFGVNYNQPLYMVSRYAVPRTTLP